MMQPTNKIMFYIVFSFFYIACKNSNDINIQQTTSFVQSSKLDTDVKLKTEIYYFNNISKNQLFPIEFSRDEIKKTFAHKVIIVSDNTLKYSACTSQIVKKTKQSTDYFNGRQSIELYNDILDEFKLNIDSKINYIELLYPDNECNLPSESFFLIDDVVFFVYKGHIILFSKTKNSFSQKINLQNLICGETTGDMEKGFITKCKIGANMNDAYAFFINESKINETKYLKEKIPTSNIEYQKEDADVEYKIKKKKIVINLFFSGGITTIEFTEKMNETEIIINSSPD